MGALSAIAYAAEPVEPWLAGHVPPEIDLTPPTPAELHRLFRGGEVESDVYEWMLAGAARARGSIDLELAEGLHALRKGDRLATLGFRFHDYTREVLDLGRRSAETLARLGAELRTRPRLREALRTGRVGLRAAETVLPVAKGDAEALWVERAARRTVRELEEAVRRTGAPAEEEEEWLRLRTRLTDAEREALDLGLEAAGRIMPGSTRSEQLEALAQEYLGEFSTDGDHDDERPLGPAFGRVRARESDARRATLEREMERWANLPPVRAWTAPDAGFDEAVTAEEVDQRLRALAELRERWDDLIGHCAHAILRSGIHLRLGFASFRHFVEERLGVPPRAVEQRAAFEERLARSPALQEGRRQKLSYERLRILARLAEHEIRGWIARAKALTCVALRRAVEGERERQLRARRILAVPLPRRVAVLLAAAIATFRERMGVGDRMPLGTCLASISVHFQAIWRGHLKRATTRSQKVRERDQGFCLVPGCSARAADAHHVQFRSRGGGDELENQAAVCKFHHLRCIHGGHLTVTGQAPDGLIWLLHGVPFTGRG